MGAQIAAPSSIAPIFLVLWGGLIMLNLPPLALWCRRALWAYLLPPLLAIDYLVVASEQPLAAGLASSGMAALGFALGLALLRGSGTRAAAQWRIGAPLVAAGLLLVA
jgi:hypothetical protein